MNKGRNHIYFRAKSGIICLFLTGITGSVCAQDVIPKDTALVVPALAKGVPADSVFTTAADTILTNVADTVLVIAADTVFTTVADTAIISFTDSTMNAILENEQLQVANKTAFKPNPKTAWLAAAVFPGFGQIYNRQYWKLPIVYGGMMGCAYAITWNNKTYQDYKTAYYDIKRDAANDPNAENPDSWSQSWQNYVSASTDPATRLNDATFHSNLKRNKDYFRRYRDLSIIIGVGIYLIFVADAYVDAQMFDFDVSPDLSFRVVPAFTPESLSNSHSIGFNVSMTF